MNKRRWLLHIFERAHEPSPQAVERLESAILEQVPDGRTSQRLLRALDAPSILQEQRLVARVSAIPEVVPQRSPLPLGLSLGRIALVGATALGLSLVLSHALTDQPEQLATTLEVQDERADLAPLPGVHLAYHGGYGELGGTTRSPSIQWIAGKLEVEVEPDRGIRLAVHTDEATVRVIGTRFTVLREDAQTLVGVERGKVEVTCSDGEQVQLTAGQQHRCASESPSKLALRAKRLRERGAEPAKVLEVVQRGLDRAQEGDAAWSHLSVLSMQCSADLGHHAQVVSQAVSYLDADHARLRDDVLRLAMDSSEQPCSLALAHQPLLEGELATPADLVTLSDCLQEQDPERARGLLVRALGAPGLATQERVAVQERIEQLR